MSIKTPLEILAARSHEIYDARKDQLSINILGWHGGQPYVQARLSRFAGESTTDWDGGTRTDGSAITGRKAQSHVIPYLARIVQKINQHVFAVSPKRDGVNDELLNDISSDGKSVDDVMALLNSYLTVCGWAWLGIDAPNLDPETQISIAEKEQLKIRPYWQAYSPLQVVDWYIDANGTIQWLITEGFEYVGKDPFVDSASVKYRKLWQPGKVTKYVYSAKNPEKIEDSVEISTSFAGVPFVLLGEISADPYIFDSLESVNRTILDLESVNRANFYHCVFPQMQLPVSVLDTVVSKFNVTAEDAVHMIMGYNYPILLSESDAEAKYIMPDSNAIGSVRNELQQLKGELYDSIGLMLRKDTKMVESAESKAFDQLDVSAILRERARILEAAETKAVLISNEADAEFPDWTPVYNKDFSVTVEDIEPEILKKEVSEQNTPSERVLGE